MAFVCHMEKYKANDCGGIGVEDDRTSEQTNKKNPNLDTSKSHLNIHRVLSDQGACIYTDTERSHVAQIFSEKKREINALREQDGKKRLRKDAVVCCSFIVTEDHDFFEDMDRESQIEFFETVVEWFNKNYGNNVLQYSIHFDEFTPHMHMRVLPQEGNSLSAKKMFDRVSLEKIQTDLPRFMREHGFDVGEPDHDMKTTHRTEAEQRIHALNERVEMLEEKLARKQEELTTLTEDIKSWRGVRYDEEFQLDRLNEKNARLRAEITSKTDEKEKLAESVEKLQKLEIGLKTRLEDIIDQCKTLEEGLIATEKAKELLEIIGNVADMTREEHLREFVMATKPQNTSLDSKIRKAKTQYRQGKPASHDKER